MTISDAQAAGGGFRRVAEVITSSGRRHRYRHAGQLDFSCPGPMHSSGDRSPSGSLTDDPSKGSAGIYCHGGCAPEDIAAGFGFDLRDLFDTPKRRQERDRSFPPDTSVRAAVEHGWMPCVKDHGHRVAHAYTYTTTSGQFRAQKLRCNRKSTCERGGQAWRTLDQSKPFGWAYGLNGVDVPLYWAHGLPWAIRNGHAIYLCEGEKDAEAFHARKIPATTAPNGAWTSGRLGGQWRAEYTEMLRGAHLVIVADLDATGHAHAQNVSNAVIDAVASLEVVVAASGKDSADHFAAGHSPGEFVTVATPKPFVLVLPPDVQAEVDAYRRGQAHEVDGVLVDTATGEILGSAPEAA